MSTKLVNISVRVWKRLQLKLWKWALIGLPTWTYPETSRAFDMSLYVGNHLGMSVGSAKKDSKWQLGMEWQNGERLAAYFHYFFLSRKGHWDLYGGGGYGVESRSEAEPSEQHFLRVPVGLQWRPSRWVVFPFFEGDGLFGPIPLVTIGSQVRVGVRALI